MTKAKIIPTTNFDLRVICGNDLGSFIRLYFPCDKSYADSSSQRASWVPGPNQRLYSYAFAKYINMGNVVGWMAHRWAKNITMDAIPNATVVDQSSWEKLQDCESLKENEKLPLIVFSHGLGGQRALYSVFCTQLASEGFIVAAIEHRDRSASTTFITDDDGNVVEIPYFQNTANTDEEKEEMMKLRNIQLQRRTEEVSYALDMLEKLDESPEDIQICLKTGFDLKTFKGRIDTTCPLMMGHSFGGATMVNALYKEPRLKCGIGLDVWFEPFTEDFFATSEQSNKPTFLIFTEYFNFKYNMKMCNQLKKHNAKDFVEVVTLKKTRHYDQCDIPGILPSFVTNWMLKKRQDLLPYADAITSQRKLLMDYIKKYFEKKGVSEPVKLLDENYALEDVFMVDSNITVDDE